MSRQHQKWQSKTLESLEHKVWPALSETDQQDWLMVECYALRKKPIKDFSIENLRQMIEQDIGLEFLIPLAIDKLKEDITAQGDCYPGDLLNNILRSDPEYWKINKQYWNTVCELFEENKMRLQEAKVAAEIRKAWFNNFEIFRQIH